MYRSLSIAFLGVALIIAGMVTAEAGPGASGFKIGFVDFDRVLTETAAGKRASKEFENELRTKQGKLDKQQKALQQKIQSFQKQASVMRPEMKKKREAQLQKEMVELQQTYTLLERELVEKRTKLIRQILKKAEPAIKSIAKEGGYDMIVDRQVVVWSDKSYDLTDKIKQRVK